MLQLVIPGEEFFDDTAQEFITHGDEILQLEHSLTAVSKWESIFGKPFLDKGEKTREETLEYIKCMIISPDVSSDVFSRFSKEHFDAVNEYIGDKRSATWFADAPGAPRARETITSELIYYWMVVFNIPFECQNWHLNRLFNLIRICNIKSAKPAKMTRAQIAARNRELNAKRREQLGTNG